MRGRQITMTLLEGKDRSIKECSLELYFIKEKKEQYILGNISKREVEYLIWSLARAREKMKYTKDEPPFLDEDLLIKAELQ